MKLVKEFKEFAVKGNMFDMAIGIIIGTAFNKIISSLVKDIIMPPFGFVLGNINFSDLRYVIQPEQHDDAGKLIKETISINYGAFLELTFDFLLITLSIFFVIKFFNLLRRKAEDAGEKTVPTPKDILLLSEIRDILKSQNKVKNETD
ncbi:MAG: large-conductance mechanosensitive channel [Bacteroidetes bacterium 4484_249]|nr:MAG: large-conductance mechanosensitive channel [Bacteroidetes bacterium 4484_249]